MSSTATLIPLAPTGLGPRSSTELFCQLLSQLVLYLLAPGSRVVAILVEGRDARAADRVRMQVNWIEVVLADPAVGPVAKIVAVLAAGVFAVGPASEMVAVGLLADYRYHLVYEPIPPWPL